MRIVAAAFAALALASCGLGEADNAAASGNQAAAAEGAKIDPCSLVTAEEVGEAIGGEIVETTPGEGNCTYATEDAQAASVTIEVAGADQMEIARTAAGTLADMGAQAASEGGAAGQELNATLSDSGDAPKVGDEAFFGPNSQLSVRKGNSYIAVQPPIMRSRMAAGNPMLSSGDRKKIALAVAEKAVARLP